MDWKAHVVAAAASVALGAGAALVDECTSDASRLAPSVSGGVMVYADEEGGSFSVRVSLDGYGVSDALLYVGDEAPVAVHDGSDVVIACLFDDFRVVPLRLVAGDRETRAGVAVCRTRGETRLVHSLDSFPSSVDARGISPVKVSADDLLRYSSQWGDGGYARITAYKASEYGTPGASGTVILDRAAPAEGGVSIGRSGVDLADGLYVLEHSDGSTVMTVNAKVGKFGFLIIFK